MFKENHRHRQMSFINTVDQLPCGVKKMMDRSWSPAFRELIFEKINERRYAALYSDVDSRPNFPVNIWVGLEIIKEIFNYTDEELLEQFHFNLLTAYAVGLENLGEVTLAERTIYYNRKRLLEYEAQTGRNLLCEEFEAVTDDALKQVGINAETQRMDSSFAGSFIKQMSRLELIVKVLQNLHRDLSPSEQTRWSSRLAGYVEDEAKHISYRLKRAEVGEHVKELGSILFDLHQANAGDKEISGLKSYQHVSRVLSEQFNIAEKGGKTEIEVKPSKEISARSLQNPADDTATFRRKAGESHKGDMFNVAETCAPENPVQLLTDVWVEQNVISDDTFLENRLPGIKERTGVKEMITDANYTGERTEALCKEKEVVIIPTEVKGRKESSDKLSLRDFHFDGNSIISCPEGHSPIEQITKPQSRRHIIRFDRALCSVCSQINNCPVRCRKRFYSLSFTDRQALLAQRRQQLSKEDYRIKCRLRPAIEGTISQFKRKMHNGKLRVRGLRRVRNSIILMAIGINFGRLWDYFTEHNPAIALSLASVVILVLVLAGIMTNNPGNLDFQLREA